MFCQILESELRAFLRTKRGVARMAVQTGSASVLERQKIGAERLKQEVRSALGQQGISEAASFLSVAHTSFDLESWILVVGSDQRLGVDIESMARPVLPSVFHRITTEQERQQIPWDVLKFWVVKEATFKANPNNRGTVLTHYCVESWDVIAQEGRVRSFVGGTQSFYRFKLLKLGRWLIAFAILIQ